MSMTRHGRLNPVFFGVALVGAGLALLLGAQGSQAAFSTTLNAYVTQDSFIGLNYADGTPVGKTIPPGTYTVIVDDQSDVHQFHLYGAGVDEETGIEDVVKKTWTVTFQAGRLYTFQCDLHADVMFGQFSATGTAAAGSTGSSSSGGSTNGSTSGGNQSNGGSSSSVLKVTSTTPDPFRGTLTGTVSAAGKVTLTAKGKAVSTLKSGRYSISVVDQATKANLVVQLIRQQPIAVTGVSFVGKHALTVDLKPGQWMFYSSANKARTTTDFIVHG